MEDDVDILLNLHTHGRSSCVLHAKDKVISFPITHIINNPYEELINAVEADFTISKKQFIILAYLQLKKIYLLLRDKDFTRDRANYFAFNAFHASSQEIEEYIDLCRSISGTTRR
jgi:hypothetical protein